MARLIHKLTDRVVRQSKKPGLMADGGGLFLQVTSGFDGTIRRSWLVRVKTADGRVREMGLGSADQVGLEKARDAAKEARDLARDGIDPIVHKATKRQKAAAEAARAITFKSAAETFISSHEGSWKNEKHRTQWRRTLEMYAYPVFGALPVQGIDTDLVMRVIEPIWKEKPETASRIRGRIETVLDWSRIRGYRDGENPARWRGHLQRALPAPRKVKKVQHHAALPYAQLPDFMKRLRKLDSISARALEFTILTAARTSETLNAKWNEIDRIEGVWTIPAHRMKAGREHRVPLGARASDIVSELDELMLEGDWVFPGGRSERPLSTMAMLELLRGMGLKVTTHGFRSTFRDWVAEQTIYPREIAEACLAHISGDMVERAYQRGDLLDRRRDLMEEWDRYANGKRPDNKALKPPKRAQTRPNTPPKGATEVGPSKTKHSKQASLRGGATAASTKKRRPR